MRSFGAATFSGTLAPGATMRARFTASPTYAADPSCFGVTRSETRPSLTVTGSAKNCFTAVVAAAGESPPTSSSPAIVTPAGMVVGRGGVAMVVVVAVVVVGGGGGGGELVVPVVVPSWAPADGVPTSSAALSRPAPEQARSRANESLRLKAEVWQGMKKSWGRSR